jgi:hypothetical protein
MFADHRGHRNRKPAHATSHVHHGHAGRDARPNDFSRIVKPAAKRRIDGERNSPPRTNVTCHCIHLAVTAWVKGQNSSCESRFPSTMLGLRIPGCLGNPERKGGLQKPLRRFKQGDSDHLLPSFSESRSFRALFADHFGDVLGRAVEVDHLGLRVPSPFDFKLAFGQAARAENDA